jgi:hypothetical protein
MAPLQPRRPWFLALYVVAAFALLIVAALGLAAYKDQNLWASWAFRVIVLFLAIRFVLGYTEHRHVRPLKGSSRRRQLGTQVELLGSGPARTLQRRAGNERRVKPLEAEIFALAITNPSLLRQRVTEQYEPERRTLRQRVTVEIQMPSELITNSTLSPQEDTETAQSQGGHTPDEETASANSPMPAATDSSDFGTSSNVGPSADFLELESILFPVIVPYKGDLNDNFRILDAKGEPVPTLAYSEYLQVAASVLRMLLLKAYDLKNGETGPELPKSMLDAEKVALRCIIERGQPDSQDVIKAAKKIAALKETAEWTEREESGQLNPEMLQLAAEFVRAVANRYAMVALAKCETNGRLLLCYERTIVPDLKIANEFKKGQRSRWIKDRLCLLLGARPIALTLVLKGAPTCRSFHLTTTCPEGLYLREQIVAGIEEYITGRDRQREAIPPYYRMQWRLGQRYSHFYSRFLPPPRESQNEKFPQLKVIFLETPPGSLFRSSIVALGSSALIWIVGYIVSHGGSLQNGAPVVLLALAAGVAAWLGYDAQSRRLLEGTLAARVSLIWTALTSVAAAALLMAYQAHAPVPLKTFRLPGNVTFLNISHLSWAILSALAIGNSIAITYLAAFRTWEYKYLCSRRRTIESGAVEEV